MAMPYSSIYLMLFFICTSYQYHGPLASTIPSNYTALDHLAASAHGRVTNTNVTMIDGLPAMDLFESEQPSVLPRSKAKDWTAAHDLSSGTLPYEVTTRNSSRDDLVKESVPCRGNCTSHTNGLSPRSHIPSTSVAPVAANGSTTLQVPPHRRPVQRGVHRRRRKRGGTTNVRKLLGVHHHPARAGNGFAAIVVGSALSVLLCALAGLLPWCMRRNSVTAAAIELEDDEPILRPELLRQVAGPRRYSYSKLATATSNFAESKRIGRGGFGSVYCGYLDEQDRHVAVKKFSMELLEQGSREFEAEVKIMSQLRHRNLVQLVGWCDSRKGLLLVYDLVPGGSLDKHLYDPERLLTWQERYKIALALGSAIQYLHTECNQCVVHGDIKPSNIMLDSSHGDTKLGDFGLARLIDHGADPQTTHVVAGTVGYMDPEFVSSQKRGTESDVYSFGIVLLEIACGRRPTAPGQLNEASTLPKRVRDMYDRNAILDAADGRLIGEFDERQMERVLVTGLWCAHRDQSRRPSIEQATSVLRSEGAELPVLPAATHGGSGQIRLLEERAYGDMSTRSSAATAYHTPEDSECFYTSPLI